MMEALSKPIRQFAALALLAALCFGLWMFVWMPVSATIRDQNEKIATEREVLGRLRDASKLEGEARSYEDKSKTLDTANLTLKGESDALRSAEMQTALTEIVGVHGLRLKSTRALPARDNERVRLIGVQAQFQATLEQLQKILIAIENHEPLLVVESLRVAGPAGASDPKSDGPLSVDIEVFGATGPAKG